VHFKSFEVGASPALIRLREFMWLEKPAGFEGRLSVKSLPEFGRSTADAQFFKRPSALDGLSAVWRPLVWQGRRGLDDEPITLTIEADTAARSTVRPESPLRLRLPEESEAFLALAFDGEDYIPVGYGSAPDVVNIVRLPDPVGGGAPTTRGIARSIRLFLYKKIGRPTQDLGMRAVELDSHGYRYIPVDPSRFKAGDRVALMVHGFLSDTGWLARDVAPFLRRDVLPYEHFLAWDYETFGTSVQEQGQDLATALRQQCGFASGGGMKVHVFAHSMGALVSRWVAEVTRGDDFIERMILIGPPNRGSALASMARSGAYLIAAVVNGLAPLPLIGAAGWALEKLYEEGHGWRDLETDSELTKRLNGLAGPSTVPYLILAGNIPAEEKGARLTRLARKLLDTTLDGLFGEGEHDGVVPMSSLRGLRGGTYPFLSTTVLPCDHFSYFDIPEGRDAVRRWVLEGRSHHE
jgi:pimeloyl-ACP methyl ester carboxylesterase